MPSSTSPHEGHHLNELSFKARPDYQPYSLAAFYEEHLRAHDFDRELSLVAEHGGRPVGFLLARRWRRERVGFVDLLGVHPDRRTAERGLIRPRMVGWLTKSLGSAPSGR